VSDDRHHRDIRHFIFCRVLGIRLILTFRFGMSTGISGMTALGRHIRNNMSYNFRDDCFGSHNKILLYVHTGVASLSRRDKECLARADDKPIQVRKQ
jgi:hypothetical protein